MWFCFNDGFVSVVKDKLGYGDLVVRARRPEILKSLFPDNDILELEVSDYKYRTYTTREEWSDIVANLIYNIDYTNFKKSVVDKDLHELYNKMWYSHYNYQR